MRRGGVCCRHNVHRVPNGIVLGRRLRRALPGDKLRPRGHMRCERLQLQLGSGGDMQLQPRLDQGFGGGVYSMRRRGVSCRHNMHRLPKGLILPGGNDNPCEVPSETIWKPNESAYGVVHRTL